MGNRRMPAEGEALVGWMTENETRWRAPSLRDSAPLKPGVTRPILTSHS